MTNTLLTALNIIDPNAHQTKINSAQKEDTAAIEFTQLLKEQAHQDPVNHDNHKQQNLNPTLGQKSKNVLPKSTDTTQLNKEQTTKEVANQNEVTSSGLESKDHSKSKESDLNLSGESRSNDTIVTSSVISGLESAQSINQSMNAPNTNCTQTTTDSLNRLSPSAAQFDNLFQASTVKHLDVEYNNLDPTPRTTKSPETDSFSLRDNSDVVMNTLKSSEQNALLSDQQNTGIQTTQLIANPLAFDGKSSSSLDTNSQIGSAPSHSIPKSIWSEGWNEDLGEKILSLRHNGINQATLKLNPDNLGSIQVHIAIDAQSVASIQFLSDNPQVRSALTQSLSTLDTMFKDAGIHLGDTNIGSQSQSTPNQSKDQEGNRKMSSITQSDNDKLEDTIANVSHLVNIQA